jgi:H+/gluconate symporter-like permease
MTGADVFVLFGMPITIVVVAFAGYLLADRSARRSELRVNEMRRQEAEEAVYGRVRDMPDQGERGEAAQPLP